APEEARSRACKPSHGVHATAAQLGVRALGPVWRLRRRIESSRALPLLSVLLSAHTPSQLPGHSSGARSRRPTLFASLYVKISLRLAGRSLTYMWRIFCEQIHFRTSTNLRHAVALSLSDYLAATSGYSKKLD
ncbi:hypothetical protein HHI36_008434, partial [Cryptolaemus montrouzieri]